MIYKSKRKKKSPSEAWKHLSRVRGGRSEFRAGGTIQLCGGGFGPGSPGGRGCRSFFVLGSYSGKLNKDEWSFKSCALQNARDVQGWRSPEDERSFKSPTPQNAWDVQGWRIPEDERSFKSPTPQNARDVQGCRIPKDERSFTSCTLQNAWDVQE